MTSIDDLIETLESAEEVAVTFITKKGLVRTMCCTLNEKYIPPDQLDNKYVPDPAGEHKIIVVYDYDNSAWRVFRKDAVISYDVIIWNENGINHYD